MSLGRSASSLPCLVWRLYSTGTPVGEVVCSWSRLKMCIRAAIYATLCLLALNCAAPDAHASQLVSKWFSYSPDIERAWTATADERDPMVITVQPKGTAESAKRVLVLYPRPSSAYDIAI